MDKRPCAQCGEFDAAIECVACGRGLCAKCLSGGKQLPASMRSRGSRDIFVCDHCLLTPAPELTTLLIAYNEVANLRAEYGVCMAELTRKAQVLEDKALGALQWFREHQKQMKEAQNAGGH